MNDEDRDMANAALLLDEKISERIRAALGEYSFYHNTNLVSMIYKISHEVASHMLIAYNKARGGRELQWDSTWHTPFAIPSGYGQMGYTFVSSVGQLPTLV